jgi:hypothetical protein
MVEHEKKNCWSLYYETCLLVLRCKREEAKITAWENLQKAKAEAAVRKLEVFLFVNMCNCRMIQFPPFILFFNTTYGRFFLFFITYSTFYNSDET